MSHEFNPTLEYNLCSIIVRGGKVLSVGFNKRLCNSFTHHYKVTEHCATTHAEMDAILRQRKKIRFDGAKIYTVRIRADGSVANSRPCPMCTEVLTAYGIKKAFYTISNVEHGVLKLG